VTPSEFRDRLARRARRAGVADVPPELVQRLDTYYRLLASWNRKINLSGMDLSEPTNDAFDRLLVEPLVAAGHAPPRAARMLDVGSGGGSPAIPFALARPGLRLVMVESKVRKSVFLREAARELGMPGAEVVNSRFELLLTRPDLHEAEDLVTIRAVRLDARVLMTLQSFLKPGGQLFLFRGPTGPAAPESVALPLTPVATHPLLDSLHSRLVVLQKA
jgi:16S rRNA (guanine527-N7)-methyltransferase